MDITDEIPFVIPETWQWVRIRDVFQLNPKNEAEDEKLVAFIPMEKISAGYKSDFTFDTAKWGTIKKGCKRIRDATLHTFIYHYIFAAKSKFLII